MIAAAPPAPKILSASRRDDELDEVLVEAVAVVVAIVRFRVGLHGGSFREEGLGQ